MERIPRASEIMGPTVVDRFKDQILITLVKKLADKKGRVVLDVEEIDDTGQDLLSMEANHVNRTFTLKLTKKN